MPGRFSYRAETGLPEIPRSVEVIFGRIRALLFLAQRRLLTGLRLRRLSACRMDSLNRGYAAQRACAGMTGGLQEQPWNCVRLRCILPRDHLARDLAAVVVFPGRAGRVTSDGLALCIEQLRLRPFQDPGKLLVNAGRADAAYIDPGDNRDVPSNSERFARSQNFRPFVLLFSFLCSITGEKKRRPSCGNP
jgi:hypothetical protein